MAPQRGLELLTRRRKEVQTLLPRRDILRCYLLLCLTKCFCRPTLIIVAILMESKLSIYDTFKKYLSSFKSLGVSQKLSIGMMLFFLLALPVSVFVVMDPVKLFSRASYPITPPITPPYTQAPTVFGKAAVFNGNTTVKIDGSESLNASLGFTVEAWIKPSTSLPSGWIVSKLSGSENSFALGVRSSYNKNEDAYDIIYTFSVSNNGNKCALHNIELRRNYSASQVNEITSWHHIAGVVQSDGKMDILFDGVKSTTNTNSITGVCPSTLPVYIGARFLNPGTDGYFPGEIDEVRISNTSRYSGSGIPALPLNPYYVDKYTIALYHMDNSVENSASGGYHGIVYGNIYYVDSTIGQSSRTPTPSATYLPTTTPPVKPTPTKYPTSTPAPRTASPTPSPVTSNHAPIITTKSLVRGMIGRPYRVMVTGTDADISDQLKMEIVNLPLGLKVGSCATRTRNLFGKTNTIVCTISGTPMKVGQRRVDIALFDGKGGMVQKSLILTIEKNIWRVLLSRIGL